MSQPIHDYQFAPDGHVTQPLRALVVEDSTLQRRVLSASLRKWGFEVHEADSGRAALEICQNFPPDVVVSDWMMPEMNGLDFCREFRAMPRYSYGYFILLTSKSDKGEVALALGLDCGADDFVTKPVNQSELRARISACARITQAGHPSPILITTRGDIQLLGQGGFPIGLLPDVGYDQFEVTLNQCDRLLFCSGGLTEAVLKSGKELGDDGLAEIIHENLTKTGRSFLYGLYISLLSHLPKGGSLDDDISAIMEEYLSGQP